jgi:Rieske Fe-S protein
MNRFSDTSRRKFFKTFALATVATGLCPAGIKRFFTVELQAATDPTIGKLRVGLSSFTALQNVNGSVYVSVPGMFSFPPLIVTRTGSSAFQSVTSICTHQGCQVGTYQTSTNSLFCPCHFSQFNPDGSVINGPAPSPLTNYASSFDSVNQVVEVDIPGLAYTVEGALASASANSRFALQFPTLAGVTYEVRFRSAFKTGSWTQVAFATSSGGAANVTTISGTGSQMTVYIDRTGDTGFYVINRF